jgi:hypothetical protein
MNMLWLIPAYLFPPLVIWLGVFMKLRSEARKHGEVLEKHPQRFDMEDARALSGLALIPAFNWILLTILTIGTIASLLSDAFKRAAETAARPKPKPRTLEDELETFDATAERLEKILSERKKEHQL